MTGELETIEELKVHLEEACHAAFRLKKSGVFDHDTYEQEFNTFM